MNESWIARFFHVAACNLAAPSLTVYCARASSNFFIRARWATSTSSLDWYGGAISTGRAESSPVAERYRGPHLWVLRGDLAKYHPCDEANLDHPYFQQDAPCTMLIDEIEALWDAIADSDDWSPFERKIVQLRTMADALGR